MAVDGNTIVTLNKKSESNFYIAKKLHIHRETVWKVVKKFKVMKRATDQARAEQSKRSIW